jgi:RHH-type transcriptional regulator, proline utilization regulon repressor / proline dehydrogenase / delta 1-pyrroline-5-carboxylate dehydrogenase
MPERTAARGLDLTSPGVLADLRERMLEADTGTAQGGPIVGGREATDGLRPARSPADRDRVVGETRDAMPDEIERALDPRRTGRPGLGRPPGRGARRLPRARRRPHGGAHRGTHGALHPRGRQDLPDGVAEVREAVDFCRYYAARARVDMARPLALRGPHAGQTVELKGGGVFVCISPWNFPLAIFMGQVTAALVAGNAVIAKPAEQTPLIAAAGTRILLEAGVPEDVLHLLPGDGATVGRGAGRRPPRSPVSASPARPRWPRHQP